jgi:HSP20 family molecular chaperone IbpA
MASSMTTTTDQASAEPARAATTRAIRPRVDIYETDNSFVLLADMPGVEPQGLDVEAERNLLVIRGHCAAPETAPDYQEFELGDYHRAFTLSEDLDTDRITATLREGVLRVEIPKSPQAQPKKIPVRADG